MIDAVTAKEIVWKSIQGSQIGDTDQYNVTAAVFDICQKMAEHLDANGIPQAVETLIPAIGLALTAWGVFINQAKSIEHGGQQPHPFYTWVLKEKVLPNLDALILESRNLGREQKIAERNAGKPQIVVPEPLKDWHD